MVLHSIVRSGRFKFTKAERMVVGVRQQVTRWGGEEADSGEYPAMTAPTTDKHNTTVMMMVMVVVAVLSPARQKLCNFSPLVAQAFVCIKKDALFVICPDTLFHRRVEMVVPTFPALLANPGFHLLGNLRPVLGTVFLDQVVKQRVLLCTAGFGKSTYGCV